MRETIQEGVKDYFKEFLLKDYKCNECKTSGTMLMNQKAVDPPKILSIVVSRFGEKKNTSSIECDTVLPGSCMNNIGYNYRFLGMLEHLGSSMEHGHYTSTVASNDGFLYYYDDEMVRISKSFFLN